MGKKVSTPATSNDEPLSDLGRWGALMRQVSGLATVFGRDRLMHTLIASLALLR